MKIAPLIMVPLEEHVNSVRYITVHICIVLSYLLYFSVKKNAEITIYLGIFIVSLPDSYQHFRIVYTFQFP